MPSSDDDIIRGGPLSYWLKYKVWGVAGYWLVAAVAVGAFVAGKCV